LLKYSFRRLRVHTTLGWKKWAEHININTNSVLFWPLNMIITDWTFIKQEIKITQDLLTFHLPQDKLTPVMSFYTFLMHIPFSVIVPHLLQTHTVWSISSEYLLYMRIIGGPTRCSNREDERLKIIFARTRFLCFR